MLFPARASIAIYALLTITHFNSFAQSASRDSFELSLHVDSFHVYRAKIAAGPYLVGPNILQIYPGEQVFLEIDQDASRIKGITAVNTNSHPEKTIIVSLRQETSGGLIHRFMMLSITNPFKTQLRYSANMLLMKQGRWVPTNVLPVKAGMTSYETWPDPLVSVALSKWSFEP